VYRRRNAPTENKVVFSLRASPVPYLGTPNAAPNARLSRYEIILTDDDDDDNDIAVVCSDGRPFHRDTSAYTIAGPPGRCETAGNEEGTTPDDDCTPLGL